MKVCFLKNWDIFFCLLVYFLFYLVTFNPVLIHPLLTFPQGDVIWWFEPFHYFLTSILHFEFPYWNPYVHGGEPFHYMYGMYRFLDPTILFPIALEKIFKIDTLTLYQAYYCFRGILYQLGVSLFVRVVVRTRWISALSALFVLLLTSPEIHESMLKIDGICWAPWMCFCAYKSWQMRSTIWILLTTYFMGILIGTSSYHFLYFVFGFCFPFAISFAVLHWKNSGEFIKEKWRALLCAIALLVVLSTPLLAIILDLKEFFSMSRVFGSRDEYLANFLKNGRDLPSYNAVFVNDRSIQNFSIKAFLDFLNYLLHWHVVQTKDAFLATLYIIGLFRTPIKVLLSLFLALSFGYLLSLGAQTPFHYFVYKHFAPLQAIRHLIGFSYASELFYVLFICIALQRISLPPRNNKIAIDCFVAGIFLVAMNTLTPQSGITNECSLAFAIYLIASFLLSSDFQGRKRYIFPMTLISFIAAILFLILPNIFSVSIKIKQSFMNRIVATGFVNSALTPLGTKYDPSPAQMPPVRKFAENRSKYILYECALLQNNCALTTLLEPAHSGNDLDLAYIKYVPNYVIGNRAIYWTRLYLEPYLLGEKNIYQFADILGVNREAFAWFPDEQSFHLDSKIFLSAIKEYPSSDSDRLTDHALFLNDSVNTSKPKNFEISSFPSMGKEKMRPSILSYSPNHIVLSVVVPRSGYLLYRDAWSSWWRARVNNGPLKTPIRANHLFKAVQVAAGQSVIEFIYVPILFRNAIILYFLAHLLLLFWILRQYKLQKMKS